MRTLNWGILGPGKIAHTFAAAMQSVESAKILAVASRSSQRAKQFAQQYQIAKEYNDYALLLADPDIEIVYIATPHNFHYPQAKMCLEAGKHVLIEKPCTINAAQMQTLVELAEQRGLLLQEGLWSRFMPALGQLRQRLQSGAIGDIQYIQSDIGFAFQTRPKARLSQADLAGGALLDLGIYSISVAQFLLQEQASQIQACGQLTEQQVDSQVLANLIYPSGRYSQFSCSMQSQSSNSMRIVGSQGFAILPANFWDTNQAEIYQDNQMLECIDWPHRVNGFEYQIEACGQAIEQGLTCHSSMSHQDSIGVLKVMDSIRQQIGLQFPVSIEQL
ncbi:Gfo/Idh/MocA family protein [Paraglaciecola aestuariivivens]